LLIEKYSELYVDGCHLSQPSHSIRHAHGLCLVDTQEQDQRTVNSTHQLENILDDKRKFFLNLLFVYSNTRNI
jgi:hypothetical protein